MRKGDRAPRRDLGERAGRIEGQEHERLGNEHARTVAQPSEAAFRHLEFLRLSERRVLLIIVTPEGDVQNRILHTDRAYTTSQLIEATNFFNQHYSGHSFEDIRQRVQLRFNRRRSRRGSRSMPASSRS